ncbi:MAG: hemerythrin domain-containing protein [Candidatus Xenobia bacterium]
MDVFELLRRDHTRLAMLLVRLLDEQDLGLRKITFSQLRTELAAHVEMGESLLYPLLEHNQDGLLQQAYQVHYILQQQVEALEGHSVGSFDWIQAVNTLQHALDSHIRLEDELLFPRMQQMLPPDHALQLGQESSRLKLELMGIRY